MRKVFHKIRMFFEGRRIWKDKMSESLHSVIVNKEDTGWIVLTDVASGIASQGRTYKEAQENLNEALELYYDDNSISEGEKRR